MEKFEENKININSASESELISLFEKLNEKKFRVKQLMNWIYNKHEFNFENMSNFSETLKKKLKNNFEIFIPEIDRILRSDEDDTVKFSLILKDNERIETVLIDSTVCLSTQIGCTAGCRICRTAEMGFIRNLSTEEIIAQLFAIKKQYPEREIKNIVFMGMGEPLLNYNNLIKSIRFINMENTFNIGMRKITVSTVGIIPGIKRLAEENMQITLALSLHAPTDNLRDELIPLNKKYPVEELLKATDYYFNKTGRRVSFEYIMLNKVNDNKSNALKLAKLLKNRNCHVNLIGFNSFEGSDYVSSQKQNMLNFKKVLEEHNINCTIRASKGQKILAGCGQLKAEGDNS